MKTSGVLLSVVGVVAFLGGGTWEYMQYNTATKDKAAAEENIQLATLQHNQLVNEEASLKAQLEQAQQDTREWQAKLAVAQDALHQAQDGLAQAQSRLPGDTNNLDYDEILLAMAKTAGVKVLSLTTSDKQEKDIQGNIGFADTTFTMEIKGTMADIIDLYNSIINDDSFRTALVEPLSVSQPLPVTDAEKAAMAESLYAEALAAYDASLSIDEQIALDEKAVMDLLGLKSTNADYLAAANDIVDGIRERFGNDVANRIADDIANAFIEDNVKVWIHENLISTVATAYGEDAAIQFEDGTWEVTPVLQGYLGSDITDILAVQYAPEEVPGMLAGIVTQVIADRLNAMVGASKATNVDTSAIAQQVEQMAAQAELASSSITVTVTAYQGGSDG